MVNDRTIRHVNTSSGVVYMCFDADRAPIYVGKTTNWSLRRKDHMGSIWWPRVRSIHFIPAFDHEDRTRTERAMIGLLGPEFNMSHTGRMSAVQSSQSITFRWSDAEKEAHRLSLKRNESARRATARAKWDAGEGPVEVGLWGFDVRPPAVQEVVKLFCGHCRRETVTTRSIRQDGQTVWLCGPESGCPCYEMVVGFDHPLGCRTCIDMLIQRNADWATFLAGGKRPPRRVFKRDLRRQLAELRGEGS